MIIDIPLWSMPMAQTKSLIGVDNDSCTLYIRTIQLSIRLIPVSIKKLPGSHL